MKEHAESQLAPAASHTYIHTQSHIELLQFRKNFIWKYFDWFISSTRVYCSHWPQLKGWQSIFAHVCVSVSVSKNLTQTNVCILIQFTGKYCMFVVCTSTSDYQLEPNLFKMNATVNLQKNKDGHHLGQLYIYCSAIWCEIKVIHYTHFEHILLNGIILCVRSFSRFDHILKYHL